MKVTDVMTSAVVGVPPSTTLRELARVLSDRRISGVPVLDDDGDVVGVVSETDLVANQASRPATRGSVLDWLLSDRPAGRQPRPSTATTVAHVMTAPAVTVGAACPVREAAALMVKRGVNRLPVMEAGRLVGIVTRSDLVRAYLLRDDEILRVVREDVLRHTMWLDPAELAVEVREGVVRISGTVDRRSTATIIEKLIRLVDGVHDVANDLTWTFDDSSIEALGPAEHEPGAASLTARERPRALHG